MRALLYSCTIPDFPVYLPQQHNFHELPYKNLGRNTASPSIEDVKAVTKILYGKVATLSQQLFSRVGDGTDKHYRC